MENQINIRSEKKIVIDSANLSWARSIIRLHTSGFHQAYPPRQVNNVYFDSPDLDCFFDNIDGLNQRNKFRLRWYGESLEITKSTFEIKHKINRYNWKTSFQINEKIDLRKMKWEEIISIIRKELPDDLSMQFSPYFCPIIINQYFREYYVSFDRKVRITLDYNQCGFEQRGKISPDLRQPLFLPDITIIEIKSDEKLSSEIFNTFNELPFRTYRNSKYGVCVRAFMMS